jgi:Bacterial toxin 44
MKNILTILLLFWMGAVQATDGTNPAVTPPVTKTPVFLPFDNRADLPLYRYDSSGHTFLPTPFHLDKDAAMAMGFDPVRFTITAKQDTLQTGKEIELTITAEYLSIHPMLMFTADGSTAYTLKMLLPDGFVVTGGTYYDYLKGKVSATQPLQTYSIKGFFENILPTQPCFTLLRSHADAGTQDVWVKKANWCGVEGIGKEKGNASLRQTAFDNTTLSNASLCELSTYSVEAISPQTSYGTFGCLKATYAPAWFIIKVTKEGKMQIDISSGFDVDFICWGPIDKNKTVDDIRAMNEQNLGTIQDQSFDGSPIETCNFGSVQVRGRWCFAQTTRPEAKEGYYILMVSNFSNETTNITLQTTLSGAITSCGTSNNLPIISITTSANSLCNAETATLTASVTNCTTADIRWAKDNVWVSAWNGQVSIPTSDGGSYKAQCSTAASNVISITRCLVPIISITTSANSLCNAETATLTASVTNCTTAAIRWAKDNVWVSALNGQVSIPTSDGGSYKAQCSTAVSNVISITKGGTPSPPSITSSTTVTLPNEYVYFEATGCNGTIQWYRNGSVIADAVGIYFSPSLSTSMGTFTATCQAACGTSAASAGITVSYSPLQITSSKPDNEVYPNEEFTITATGCAAGWYVEWLMPPHLVPASRFIINPTLVAGPGVYKARCVSPYNAAEKTEWSSLTMTERPIAKVTLTAASRECIYGNQKVAVTASGCNGVSVAWWDGVTAPNPAVRELGPGSYTARCVFGSGTTATYGAWESIQICLKDIEPITIFSDKTEVNPLESFQLSATNCSFGDVQWELPNGVLVWGRTITAVGPGGYRGRCMASDNNIGPWVDFQMPVKIPGSITIISSKPKAKENEPFTLTAIGCQTGTVIWEYTVGTISFREQGQSIPVIGPNTYYASCVSFGFASSRSSITIVSPGYNTPSVLTDKQLAHPSSPVYVNLSGCSPSNYWFRVTGLDGVARVLWLSEPKTIIYGPFSYEAGCVTASGGVNESVSGSVGLSTVENIQLVANKYKVYATESVTLTTYGCDYGTVEWKIGNQLVASFSGRKSIQQTGPGYYYARCRNDFFKNDDWVMASIQAANDIGPIMNGPNRLCPNTTATLTASNCPWGWGYQWYSAERGWNNFANELLVQLPQTVLCRCSKPDFSWFSPSKELTIDTPFPSLYKASSNSPVAVGSDLRLAATDVSESSMTYLWTPPSGVTLPSGTVLTQRTLTLPNAQENYGGTYQLVVGYGGCQLTTSTTVTISACDNLYIKSYNASTGTETTQLKAKAGVLPRSYERLTLQAQTLDGKLLPNATYTWVAPTGVSLGQDASRPYAVTTDRVGNYKVTVGFAGSSQTCPLAIDIAATPCQLYTDGNCSGTSNIKDTGTGNVNIANLAIGDIFQAGDYEVTVTKLSTGSQASGYTGEGLVQQNLISGIKIPLTVTFENIKINECYQYYNHTPTDASIYVKTKFDESWSNIRSISYIKDTYINLIDLLSNYTGSDADKELLQKYTDEIEASKTNDDIFTAINNSESVSQEIKAANVALQNKLNADKSILVCLRNSSSARIKLNSEGGCNASDAKNQLESSLPDIVTYSEKVEIIICNSLGQIENGYDQGKEVFLWNENKTLTKIGSLGETINLNGILEGILQVNRVVVSLPTFDIAKWISLVMPGGAWDYKNVDSQSGNIFGVCNKYFENNKKKEEFLTKFSFKTMVFQEPADIGNFNYGYTGRHFREEGINKFVLFVAAGYLQTGKDLVKPGVPWSKFLQEVATICPGPNCVPPYGDEPDDYLWDKTGQEYADNEK